MVGPPISIQGMLTIPEGYRIIPIHDIHQDSPLRLGVLVRKLPDPATGYFVMLRDLGDAQVLLGGVVDAGGQVLEWIEIWIQNISGLAASLPNVQETFSNFYLDQRWIDQCRVYAELAPADVIRTGWESVHPLPTFIDLSAATAIHPLDPETGHRWELCADDALLQGAGLPPYATSLNRYLFQKALGKDSRFVPVVSNAPADAAVSATPESQGGDDQHLPLNAQAGLMRTTRFYPLGFEDYADLLSGKPWGGLAHSRTPVPLDEVYSRLENWAQVENRDTHLFLGAQGQGGRFIESYHLKLHLLHQAFGAARSSVQQLQLPFLNLSGDSFRVKIDPLGAGLPALWTAKCALVNPSQAHALPIKTTEHRYFIRTGTAAASIYMPEGLGLPSRGTGTIRIRKVLPPDKEGSILEGTLVLQDQVAVSPHDLLWMRLPLATGRIDLYGHVYAAESLARGEARFRTVAQQFPESVVTALSKAEGVAFARSPYEVVPLLSSPCDLFSLGVLAVRTLLVNEQNSLGVALDELLSLARQVGVEHNSAVPLSARIQAIFRKDARWSATLGPHALTREKLSPETCAQLLPAALWFDTLALLVRLFPGTGPDSICRDFGDVPALALETIFAPPIAALQDLLVRSRSLIVIDWNVNREIHAVIKKFLEKEAALEP
jgi:hypothetical protein